MGDVVLSIGSAALANHGVESPRKRERKRTPDGRPMSFPIVRLNCLGWNLVIKS